jgi:hypothetical protein
MIEQAPKPEDLIKKKIASIPDDDMGGWIQSLRAGGFTDKEMDEVLGNLNQTYRKMKGMHGRLIDQETVRIEKIFLEKYGIFLNHLQRSDLN